MTELPDRFEPNWISPPGATVHDLLKERGCTVYEFAEASETDVHSVARLIFGLEKLDEQWASKLASVLGSSPTFWLRRERQYRDDLDKLSSHSSGEDLRSWLEEVPVRDMIKWGWIDDGDDRHRTLTNVLSFFGVSSLDSWKLRYEPILCTTALRKSTKFSSRLPAVAAWLRQGEILASEIDCAPWNPGRLSHVLEEARTLTRIGDPTEFVPRLTKLFASSGVAVVIARAPSGCPVSGAVRFIDSDQALMLLSFRYLSDDQFWFTVFHEAGHLILHEHDELFLEGIQRVQNRAETEADEFAKVKLFGVRGIAALTEIPLNKFSIARFARRTGVSPGLIVGQLQEMGRVPYKHFNYLKTRYSWAHD
jgi:HTH-type transcriptional regulator/antitoxin HigA